MNEGRSDMKEPQVRLHVWSDYACPFCYLELPVLDRVQEEYGDRVAVEWHAFELRPEPIPTLVPDGRYLQTTWRRSVYPMAAERGMLLRLPPLQPRSRMAHEAAAYARDEHRFDAMHRAIFAAFFEDGRDVGSVDVLAGIGERVGLDAVELRRALEQDRYTGWVWDERALADQLGIEGVPAIVAVGPGDNLDSGGIGVSGAHPYETIRMLVERAAAGRGVV
jgi:predicted DsbA family dithiol-disulfide isomerase